MDEAVGRAAIVSEAMSWLRTPYHHEANIKGVGVDCAMIMIEVFSAVGLIKHFDPRPYRPDWHLHQKEERYVNHLEEFMHRVEEYVPEGRGKTAKFNAEAVRNTQPGNVVVWRVGRTFSHGGIITRWPYVIHASAPSQIVLEEKIQNNWLSQRRLVIYSFWEAPR
jgi:cell wall-associated NlpC family hydrolase